MKVSRYLGLHMGRHHFCQSKDAQKDVMQISAYLLCVAAYEGPYNMHNPDNTTTKVQVLHVTPDSSKTDDFTDSDDDIPTISTGEEWLQCARVKDGMAAVSAADARPKSPSCHVWSVLSHSLPQHYSLFTLSNC